jgi:hypothetical protein
VPLLALSGYIVAAAGGGSLVLRCGGGLYPTTAVYFAYLLVAVLNVYLLPVPHGNLGKPRKTRRPRRVDSKCHRPGAPVNRIAFF